MSLFADAWISLKRNQSELLKYAGALSVFILVTGALALFLGLGPDHQPGWLPFYRFLMTLVQAAFQSALMAVVFARLGEDIDAGMWRCPSDREALRRFFLPWFIINLFMLTLLRLSERAAEAGSQTGAFNLLIFFLIFWLFALPAGTCIMFHGRLHWPEVGIALRPLLGRFDLTFLVIAALLFQFLLLLIAESVAVPASQLTDAALWTRVKALVLYWPLAAIPINLLDVYAFAMMWRICMVYRDEEAEEEDPYDF